eukprot:3581589-Rhodomonas_salina.1
MKTTSCKPSVVRNYTYYAHSITLGYNKERYYLLFVVGGRNFMGASPTTTRKEQEVLLREFLAVTRLKI